MEDVEAEIKALKTIYNSYGSEREYDMFMKFHILMDDVKFYKLVKLYEGNNPGILKLKRTIK